MFHARSVYVDLHYVSDVTFIILVIVVFILKYACIFVVSDTLNIHIRLFIMLQCSYFRFFHLHSLTLISSTQTSCKLEFHSFICVMFPCQECLCWYINLDASLDLQYDSDVMLLVSVYLFLFLVSHPTLFIFIYNFYIYIYIYIYILKRKSFATLTKMLFPSFWAKNFTPWYYD